MTADGLVIRNLSKSYGRRPVLTDIEMEAAAGTVTAVTGANGCGKSTLLRCVAGLASHSGEVTFRGRPVAEVRDLVGYLPQSVGLTPWATVGETIEFFGRLRGADPADLPFPAGFVPEADRSVGVLSGGQRQRVALAVALLGKPQLLLLDEPFSNLDDDSRVVLWEVLAEAAAEGATVLVATPTDADLGLLPRFVVRIVDGHAVAANPDIADGRQHLAVVREANQ
jgi:ABC-2 type transport system ATP-binding protein